MTEAIRLILGVYVVSRFARITRGLKTPEGKPLIIGQGATIAGGVTAGGDVQLAKGVVIQGDVVASGDVVVGAEATVFGDVEAKGDVRVLTGGRIQGALRGQRDVLLLGGAVAGLIEAGGDVRVRGETRLSEVRARGRIVTIPTYDEPA